MARNSYRVKGADPALARWWKASPGSGSVVSQSTFLLPRHHYALWEQKGRWCQLLRGPTLILQQLERWLRAFRRGFPPCYVQQKVLRLGADLERFP